MLNQDCAGCTRCGLASHRQRVVPGVGRLGAKILFLGSSPLADEEGTDPRGPEVAELMARMITKMGMDHQVYFTHVVRCKTPAGRPPEPQEMNHCRSWLEKELELVCPSAIVTLGTVATQHLLQLDAPIAKLRGKWRNFRDIPVMPTYHPQYMLKKPASKKDVWSDMQAVLKILSPPSQ